MKRLATATVLAAALAAPGLRASAIRRPRRRPLPSATSSIPLPTDLDRSRNPRLGIGGGGSGTSNFSGGAGDQGTIAVDVIREQPDHGLVVSVSENAQHDRSAPAATCVVYRQHTAICDPTRKSTKRN